MRYLSDHIKLAERKKIVTFCNSQGKNDSISHLFKHFGWLYKKSKHTHTHTAHTDVVNVKHFTQQGLVAHFITVVKDATHQGINGRQ